MSDKEDPERLSQMQTSWTMLFHVHRPAEASAEAPNIQSARESLLRRYEAVVRLYLRSLLRGEPNREEAVEDCYQEFALRFVSGRFRGAEPGRGRFRDYLKSALRNLANDHLRNRRGAVEIEALDLAKHDQGANESDPKFTQIWRDELMSRVLREFEDIDRASGHHLHAVLQLRMDEPNLRAAAMAERLCEKVGKAIDEGWIRKRLYLARQRLGELILTEIRQSLDAPTTDDLAQELADVGLLEYCRDFLPRSV